MSKIVKEFFLREDVIQISKDLIGVKLFTCIDGLVTGGIIVETEAYMAPEDKASHAYGNRHTPRTETFFKEGGIAYVYLCYGIHYLFNIVTNTTNIPHAILIRAIEPLEGIDIMLHRRNKTKLDYSLTSGPGSLSMALGISKRQNAISVLENEIWLEPSDVAISEDLIIAGPRVGVSYAKDYALMPWRFFLKNSPWVSKAK